MGTAPKQTPLTIGELVRLWAAAIVDPFYSEALIQALKRVETDQSLEDSLTDPPGVDPHADVPNGGYEVFTQAMAQTKRVSEAVVRTFESLFILPWSGQTDEPASGARKATVELVFTRVDAYGQECSLFEGQTWVEELQVDASKDGGIEVQTERRYVLLERVVFTPGDPGPKAVLAEAEKVGRGYNNPLPGTIHSIIQKGAGSENDGATVVPGVENHRLECMQESDVPVPEHVGQYVQFVGGLNFGKVVRVVGYESPTSTNGGTFLLARTAVFKVTGVTGTFVLGEAVKQATTGAKGVVSSVGAGYAVIEAADDLWATTFVMTGQASGATATVEIIEKAAALLPEVGTAAWKVLTWAERGVSVTNELAPTGGRHDVLDELGRERNIGRSPGESDAAFRRRVASLPDNISPNAILRAANRILAQFGVEAVLREVGTAQLPGLFCDFDAMDYNPAVNASLRWKVQLDYASFRAFFLLEVPPLMLGEFGFSFDVGETGAYDAAPFPVFFDGFPLTAAVVYLAVWTAINAARAAGVGFELYLQGT